jgi:hypothetical protein
MKPTYAPPRPVCSRGVSARMPDVVAKAPRTKDQAPQKLQIPSSKITTVASAQQKVATWRLELTPDLELGIPPFHLNPPTP